MLVEVSAGVSTVADATFTANITPCSTGDQP
jgi:hypothetical protein